MNDTQQQSILDALCSGLVYCEDVLNNPAELSAFKPGAVQRDAKRIRKAIQELENIPLWQGSLLVMLERLTHPAADDCDVAEALKLIRLVRG